MDKQIQHILVVDDDPNMIGTVSDILLTKGFEPLTALTGSEALFLAGEHYIAAALIDLRLGDMDGLEVLRRLKEQSPDIECILLTGHASQSSAIEAIRMGAFGYFQKPFDIEQVLLSLRQAVEKNTTAKALRDNEARYRLLFESAPVGIFSATCDGRIIEINPTALQILGSPSVEATRAINLLTFPLLIATGFSANFKACAESGLPVFAEQSYTSKWGKSVYAQYSLTPIQGLDKNVTMIQVIIEDITDRKQMENSLRESEERYQLANLATSNAVWDWDIQTGKVWWNENFRNIFGYSKDDIEFNYHSMMSLVHPQDFERVKKSMDSAINSGQQNWFEQYRHRRKDGSYAEVEDHGLVSRDTTGKPLHMIGAIKDITESKLSEDALRESEKRYHDLFEDSPIALREEDYSEVKKYLDHLKQQGVTDFQQYFEAHPESVFDCAAKVKVVDVNKAALKMYRADSKYNIPFNFAEILDNTALEHFASQLIYIAAGKTEFNWEGVDHTIDGRQINVDVRWSVAAGYGKDLSKVIVSLQDITERKQAEEEIGRKQALLAEAQRIGKIGHWEWSADSGDELVCSDEMYNILEIPQDGRRITRKTIADMLAPQDREKLQEMDRIVFSERADIDYEYRIILPGDRLSWIHQHVKITYGADGSPLRMIGVIQDVTERKLVDDALHKSDVQYRLLANNISDVIWILDVESGTYTYVSPSVEQLRGYSVAEVMAQRMTESLTPASFEKVQKIIPERLAEAQSGVQLNYTDEVEQPCKDGSTVWTEVISHYIFNVESGHWEVYGVSRNITERKQVEEFVARQSRQLKLLYETSQQLNRTLDLQEIYQAVCDFMSKIAVNDSLIISAFDRETQLITCRAYWIENRWLDVSPFPSIPLEEEGRGTQSMVIRSGQSMLIDDYQEYQKKVQALYRVNSETNEVDTESPPDEDLPRSALIVPLKVGGQVSGVIQVLSCSLHAYTENQLNMLEALTLHIASAEQNALLYAQVQTELIERRLVERSLREREEQYRILVEQLPAVVYLDDVSVEGRSLYISPQIKNVLGFTPQEWLENSPGLWKKQIHPDDLQRCYDGFLRCYRDGESFDAEYRMFSADGRLLWFKDQAVRLLDENGRPSFIHGVMFDITERKNSEEGIRKSNERFELLGKAANDAVWEWDLEANIIWANQTHQELFGLTTADPVPDDMEWKRRLHPDEREQIYQELQDTRASTQNYWVAEYRFRTENKGWIDIYARTYIERNMDGKAIRMIGSMVDITERKQAEANVLRINRLYTTFSEINQIIVRVNDQRTLFEEVCRVAVEHGKFRMAWIGLIDQMDYAVKPYVFAGDDGGYLKEKDLVIAPDNERYGLGPTGTSIREGHCVICRDIATDPFMEPWRDLALSYGYRSSASIPIYLQDRAIGALSVYSGELDGFGVEDEKLLDEIGKNISFALNTMWVEAQSRRVAEELQASEVRYRGLFDSMIDGFALHEIICDANGEPIDYRFLEINPAFERLTGLKSADLLGRTVLEVLPNTEPYWIEIYGNVALSGRSTFYENYSNDLGRYFEVSVYCPQRGQFAVVIVDITERKKAEENIHQHVLELELLYESGLAFSQLLNPKDIAQKIIHLLEQKMDWHHTAIRLFDTETNMLQLLAFNQPSLTSVEESTNMEQQLKAGVARLNQGISGWVIEHGQAVRTTDLLNDERYVETLPGMVSGLYVPIKLGDRTIGVITIESEKPNAFSEADERLTSTLANQAASTLENARLFDETRQRLAELTALHGTGQRLLAARLSPEQIYAAVHHAVSETMPCEAFVIVLSDEERGDYEAVYFFDKGQRFPARRLPRGSGLSGQIFSTGDTILIDDVAKVEVQATHFGSMESTRSILAVPLRRGDEVIGMLSTQSYKPHAFGESQRVLLETITAQLSSALDNSNLYQQTRSRIKELETLHYISTSLRTIQSIQEALSTLLDNTLDALGTDAGTILLYDPSVNALKDVVYRGWFEDVSRVQIKAGEGVAGTVFASGEPYYSAEFIHDALPHSATREKIPAGWGGVCLPIRTSNEIIGVMFVSVQQPRQISLQQVKMLESLVDMAGAAIHRMRLFDETARRAEEFASLYEMSKSLSAEHNLEALLELIGRHTKTMLNSSASSMYLYEAASQDLVLTTHTSPHVPLGLRLHLGEGMAGKVAQTRQPLRIDDYSTWEGRSSKYDQFFIHGAVEVPMLYAGELIGVLAASEMGDSTRKYTDADERLLSLFASQAAGAIDSARHREETLRHAEELEQRVIERTAEIESTRKRLDLAAKAGGIGVWELNLKENELFWDARMHIIHGTEPESFDNSPEMWWRVIHAEDLADVKKQFNESLRRTGVFSHNYRVVRPDGTIRHISANAIVISDEDYVPERVIGVNVDVSDRKLIEETLQHANLEMERAMRTKDEFLANMSHELRTPLNAILGISESLEEQFVGPLNEKQLRYTGIIRESGRHLLELINDILDISKIEAGRMELELQQLSIDKICQSCLRMTRELAQKKSLKVSYEIVDSIEIVSADERRLKQSLVNLLSNAVKFTPDGGNIGLEVCGHPLENEITFTVWDNGVGIAHEDMKLLFQPFVQLDAGLAREYQGTGLGLALVSQMMRLHGGRVSLESEVGAGSRFTITLPWMPEQQNARVKTAKELPRPILLQPEVKREGKILLVEDTEVIVSLMNEFLQYKGYQMFVARDGMEGVLLAKQEHPDLILMDLMMPIMDGIEAAKHIREDDSLKDTPIIALTALAMSGDRERCLAAGMNDYMSKPIRIQELSDMIEKYLSDKKKTVNEQ